MGRALQLFLDYLFGHPSCSWITYLGRGIPPVATLNHT
jgi:hypothetical protein